MNQRPRAVGVILTVAIASASLLFVGRMRLSNSQHRLASVTAAAATTQATAEEILRLRSSQPRVQAAFRPADELHTQITDTLLDAGLSRDVLRDLMPLEQRRVSGDTESPIERHSVRLRLDDLQLSELGRFVQGWRDENPLWTVTSIDLTKSRTSSADSRGYHVILTLCAVYKPVNAPSIDAS